MPVRPIQQPRLKYLNTQDPETAVAIMALVDQALAVLVSSLPRPKIPIRADTSNTGQTNSQGDALQCDEYPFANSVESSPSAWAACVSEFSNGAQGDLLASFLSGRHTGFLYEVVITGIDCTTVPTNANPGLNANCL